MELDASATALGVLPENPLEADNGLAEATGPRPAPSAGFKLSGACASDAVRHHALMRRTLGNEDDLAVGVPVLEFGEGFAHLLEWIGRGDRDLDLP